MSYGGLTRTRILKWTVDFYSNPLECLINKEPEGKLAFLSVRSCLYGSFLYVEILGGWIFMVNYP